MPGPLSLEAPSVAILFHAVHLPHAASLVLPDLALQALRRPKEALVLERTTAAIKHHAHPWHAGQ